MVADFPSPCDSVHLQNKSKLNGLIMLHGVKYLYVPGGVLMIF